MIDYKQCAHCGRTLPVAMFCRKKTATDGYQSFCRDCQKQSTKPWQDAQKELRHIKYELRKEHDQQEQERINKLISIAERRTRKNYKVEFIYLIEDGVTKWTRAQ